MNKHNGVSAEGRLPPPEDYRIPKGKSGNYKGRPRGSVSLTKLTGKVANTKYRAVIDGVSQRRTLLELVILRIQALALKGNPGAAALIKATLIRRSKLVCTVAQSFWPSFRRRFS